MKKLLVPLVVLFAVVLFASTVFPSSITSTATFASNYIYHGVSAYNSDAISSNPKLNENPSSSSGMPIVELEADYKGKNFGGSLFTGNVQSYNYKDSLTQNDNEIEYTAYYNNSIKKLDYAITLEYETYIKNSSNNYFKYGGIFTYKKLTIEPTYVDNITRPLTNSIYSKITFIPDLYNNISLDTHIAYTWYRSPINSFSSNYYDYLIGIEYSIDNFTIEGYYTNTINRKVLPLNENSRDDALTINITKTVTIY